MKHPANKALHAHWRSLCRGRRTPDRHDLDPAAIRNVLAYTFMLEVDEGRAQDRTYPIRLSGTRTDALFGRGLKGSSFLTLWRDTDRTEMRSLIADVLDDGRPAVVGGCGAPSGHSPVPVELALLPLRHQGLTHARVLCSLAPASMPSWLGISPAQPLALTSWRMLDGIAIEAAEWIPATRRLSGSLSPRRHLVVHEGGKSLANIAADHPAQSHVKAAMSRS